MNEIVSNLLVYGSLPEDSILWQLADICEKLKNQTESKDALRGRVFHQVKNLLTVATDYAFDKNLWHNYLTFLLITNENPFSLVCEKMGAQDGTVNNFVTHDILPEMIFLPSKICLSMIFLKLRNLLVLTVSHRFPIIVQLRKKS